MRCWVVVIVMLASSVALAQPDKIKAEAAARDGQQRYQSGAYLLAAERFELAYELDPDPAYLFNLAQAYRLGHACAKSAAAYRKLLGIVSTGPNVHKVQQYIEQMDACAKTQEPIAPAPVPPVVTTPVEEPRRPPAPPREPDGGKPVLRYTGIGLGVLGGVGIVVGALATRKVGHFEGLREDLCRSGCTWAAVKDRAAEYDREGKRYQRRMAIAYVGGGVAIAAGITMVLLSREQRREVRAVAITPTDGGVMAFGTVAF